MYVQPGDGYEKGPLHWSKPQLATLRQAALGLLYSMAPCFPQVINDLCIPSIAALTDYDCTTVQKTAHVELCALE